MGSRVIIFDLMDTVVIDPFFHVVLPTYPTLLEQLAKHRNPDAWPAFERGELDEAGFIRGFYRTVPPPGLPAPDGLCEMITSSYRFVDGMEALLAQLKARGHPLWVLSNYPVWYRIVIEQLRLDRFFDGYAISCEIGARKPDPAAFRALVALTHRPLEQLVLVDDRTANCEAATQMGMVAIEFESSPQLRDQLCARGWL